jgi:hypothetical protein
MLLPMALSLALQVSPAPQISPAPQVPPAAPAPRPAPKVYNETADAQKAIDAAIKLADEDGIRVLINWGANDDERAAKFVALRRDAALGRLFTDEYRAVYVDVGKGDRNIDVANRYHATIDAGSLPALTILDGTGKVLAQGSSRALQSDSDPATFDATKVNAFLTKYKAPAPDANAPFDAAMDQAKREGKYVFVWFAAPW